LDQLARAHVLPMRIRHQRRRILGRDAADRAVVDGEDERLLAWRAGIDRPNRDSRTPADLLHREAVPSLLDQQLLASLQNAFQRLAAADLQRRSQGLRLDSDSGLGATGHEPRERTGLK